MSSSIARGGKSICFRRRVFTDQALRSCLAAEVSNVPSCQSRNGVPCSWNRRRRGIGTPATRAEGGIMASAGPHRQGVHGMFTSDGPTDATYIYCSASFVHTPIMSTATTSFTSADLSASRNTFRLALFRSFLGGDRSGGVGWGRGRLCLEGSSRRL